MPSSSLHTARDGGADLAALPIERDLGDLVPSFVPPERFSDASFDSYIPSPAYPSQSEAVDRLRRFAAELDSRPAGVLGRLRSVLSPRQSARCRPASTSTAASALARPICSPRPTMPPTSLASTSPSPSSRRRSSGWASRRASRSSAATGSSASTSSSWTMSPGPAWPPRSFAASGLPPPTPASSSPLTRCRPTSAAVGSAPRTSPARSGRSRRASRSSRSKARTIVTARPSSPPRTAAS